MILFVFTTDGDDREDGNVYYARYLAVEASEEMRPEVEKAIMSVLDGRDQDGEYILYKEDEDFDDDMILAAVFDQGLEAEWLTPVYVVGEYC